ncbi:LysE family translocator [Aliamphritea hakodatensis]|uniref:LysE family translocator n=1 Tax=Aliamphritea hakodatensis TaxID=2895352 RepID=UPI0022FD5C41|nr:LysE family translocator [Aliamphritea hakodatensis]
MVEILAYAFGIMYTPGPSNLLSMNAGLNGQFRAPLMFCVGVACAMLLLFLLFGYSGAWLVSPGYQLLISCAGSVYIAYLAYKVAGAHIKLTGSESTAGKLSFRSGLCMQLLNPKSFVAIFPIVTVQFPAAEISGSSIFVWSVLLSVLAFGAPGSYLLMGARLGKLIRKPRTFRLLNICMALLLLYVAGDIAYHHVYLKLSE